MGRWGQVRIAAGAVSSRWRQLQVRTAHVALAGPALHVAVGVAGVGLRQLWIEERAAAGGVHGVHRVEGLSHEGFIGCIGWRGCRTRDAHHQPSGRHGQGEHCGWAQAED